MRQHRRFRGDEGFTLPEVLMTVAMLGVVMTAITGALLVAIGPDQQAADRLRASHNAQLLALHLPQDIQSATVVADTASDAPFACPAAGTHVLALNWMQTEPTTTTTYAVSYRTVDEAGDRRLIRFSCINGGAVSRLVVSRGLADGPAAARATVEGSVVNVTVTSGTGRKFMVSGSPRTPGAELTPPPGVVQSVVANPNPVGHTDGADPRLAQDVVVTVTTTEFCSNLELRCEPTNIEEIEPLNGGPNTWTATIPGGGDVPWGTGNHTLTVLIGSTATRPTETLMVT